MQPMSPDLRRLWEAETRALPWHERRAHADFHRHVIADLPDPADYARWLPEAAVSAMLRARKDQDGWYLMAEDARIAVRLGLCEAGTTLRQHRIGGFGFAVLKELRRKDT